ncbi:MAG TPA: helix-turn-helix transcriptional regulator [Longimicrobiales bacterium]|nr:helix-turn-helix transcriptional regulator [Longimicrobiales bacterium]
MSPDSLPIRLRNARGSMDIAQAAARSGIAAERIKDYESGTRQPYRKTLKRLAAAYGVSISELIGGAASSVVRGRPRVVRRRRAATSSEAAAPTTSLQVPIEAGGAVRITIELVIRVEPPQAAATPEKPTEEVAAPPVAVVEAQQQNAAAVVAAARRGPQPVQAATSVRPTPPATPIQRQDETPRDPLAAVRRAYTEFRHQKK